MRRSLIAHATNVGFAAVFVEMLTAAAQDSETISFSVEWPNKKKKNNDASLQLMSLQSSSHVRHNRNPGTMHNMTISHMQPH